MSYLNIATSFAQIKQGSTGIALKERGDCMVRALAAAADVTYNVSHKFCAEVFGRKSNTGTSDYMVTAAMLRAQESGLEIDGKKYDVSVLGRADICNSYKLNEEIVWRKKTLKSFIESHQKGSYIVFVSNHALTIKDGELIDWNSMKFKPTRKVLKAFKIQKVTNVGEQLSLF